MDEQQAIEILKCSTSPEYYIQTYCKIYDATSETWLPFNLWPAQKELLESIPKENLHIWLKARQIGLTWLSIAYALWLTRFGNETTVNLFSRRADEAAELMWRLQEMHTHTPEWLQAKIQTKSAKQYRLLNRGRAFCFPTTKNSGRSYTSTLAIIDEADYIPFLGPLLTAIKPTVDAGGRLIVLSSADKSVPNSRFKSIYREAVAGKNTYTPAFYSWKARPNRDQDWIARQTADYTTDELWQEYPETDTQALAQLEKGKRFSAKLIISHISTTKPTTDEYGIEWIEKINHKKTYLISCDPAEGTPTGDISAISIIDAETWSEIGTWAQRAEVSETAETIKIIKNMMMNAMIIIERNNHGHAIHAHLLEAGVEVETDPFDDTDTRKGWLTTGRTKVLIMANFAGQLKEEEKLTIEEQFIVSKETADQLSDIERHTLKASTGNHDDKALAYLIGIAFLRYRKPKKKHSSTLIIPH